MRRLLIFTLCYYLAGAGLVRVPKIYNALITSDENLSPSQAYPILEPVLRTTALGVAFPPLIVHPQFHAPEPTPNQNDSGSKKTKEEPQQEAPKQRLAYHGSLYPLAYDPYLPYGYHHDFLYPTLPFYQQPVFVDVGGAYEGAKADAPAPVQPKPAINFTKKNPDIPDVLPPLPIKDERKRKS